MSEPIGPNIRKLIAERAAQLQVEAATAKYGKAGFNEILLTLHADGVGGLQDNLRLAAQWAKDAVKAIRLAPGGEAFTDEDAAAAEILRLIAEKRGGADGRVETAP